MMRSVQRYATALFIGCYLLELFAVSVLHNRWSDHLNPLLWFLGSLGAGIAGYMALSQDHAGGESTKKWRYPTLLAALVSLVLMGLFIHRAQVLSPIDPMVSDIVPALKTYVQRLFSGNMVYAPIPYESWTVLPNYLPMVWMPYIPAEWLGIDYRLFAFLLLSFTLMLWWYRSGAAAGRDFPVKVALMLFSLALLVLFHSSIYIHAVEFTIATFYLLLGIALMRMSFPGIAIALLLCLMSRYSYSFWLPAFLIVCWAEFGFGKAFRLGLFLAVGATLLYVPFIYKDPSIFMDGMGYYAKVVGTLWEPFYWQQPDETPFHLARGLSFSIWFYDLIPGPVSLRLKAIEYVHLVLCLITAVGMVGFYFRFRRKEWFQFSHFALCSLNIYLAVFYAFFYAPFSYLFILPLIAKFPILLQLTLRAPAKASLSGPPGR